jgi:acyl-CoA reductase-like NAD-dependent aldehyde dehydrogenase
MINYIGNHKAAQEGMRMTVAVTIINGRIRSGAAILDVVDPTDGTVAGSVASADAPAFASWAARSDPERQAAVRACADILDAHADELAHILTAEQGKPLGGLGSRFELGGAAAWTRYTATLSLPVGYVQDDDPAHVAAHRKPLGVVASITPWNWPVMIAIWHITRLIGSPKRFRGVPCSINA